MFRSVDYRINFQFKKYNLKISHNSKILRISVLPEKISDFLRYFETPDNLAILKNSASPKIQKFSNLWNRAKWKIARELWGNYRQLWKNSNVLATFGQLDRSNIPLFDVYTQWTSICEETIVHIMYEDCHWSNRINVKA